MSDYTRSDFYYNLPQELIAQTPTARRDNSRLLVFNRYSGDIEHKVFTDITDYLKSGDCLVFNNTKVIPARLMGMKEGARLEFLLLKRIGEDVWEVLVRPGKRCRVGSRVVFGEGLLNAEVIEVKSDGNRLVKFEYTGIWEEILDRLGEMPLPPYIHEKLEDADRYQTVYAKVDGSAAAPTAGLHFTEDILNQLQQRGVRTVFLTLHVGLGTFRPLRVDDPEKHIMHSEWYSLLKDTADIINDTKNNGGRIIAVGTTSVRTLEACTGKDGLVHPNSGETDIFIYPPYRFKTVDGIITNFHLPESTLLMLISAFAGRDNVLNAYNIAIKKRYRFFSFGDACLII